MDFPDYSLVGHTNNGEKVFVKGTSDGKHMVTIVSDSGISIISDCDIEYLKTWGDVLQGVISCNYRMNPITFTVIDPITISTN